MNRQRTLTAAERAERLIKKWKITFTVLTAAFQVDIENEIRDAEQNAYGAAIQIVKRHNDGDEFEIITNMIVKEIEALQNPHKRRKE
jgi:hypothetical protein